MAQSRSSWGWRLRLACCVAVSGAIATEDRISAQVVPDNTLGAESSSVNQTTPLTSQIEGGAARGKNLFHSFEQFSIPANGEVRFNNDVNIENIITRVTGSTASNIDGAIAANGSANLLLINPNGIIFGTNASLNIGGSFLASTARSIIFADGTQFDANHSQTPPLLTVNTPIGLQFGSNSGAIVNRSQASLNGAVNYFGFPAGLQVVTGKTLALVGGSILQEGGNMTAAEGRIELGSVFDNSLVNLKPTEKGWKLGYEQVQNFQNIELNSFANIPYLDVSGESNGDLHLQGKVIQINNYGLTSINRQEIQPGNLTINASDNIELAGVNTVISTLTFGAGNGGSITFNTKNLTVKEGAQVFTSTFATGAGGKLTVNASESVQIIGSFPLSIDNFEAFSSLSSATAAAGNAGDLTINTSKLIIRDGAKISTASEGIVFDLTLNQFVPATGKGGNLTINASESVELTGTTKNGSPSTLTAIAQGGATAGNLRINTKSLTIGNEAEISVSSFGTGNAGNLEVTANSIRVEDGGKLTATSKFSSDGGNINLQNLDLLTLRNNGEISTSAEGAGDGGNINVDTDNLVLAERSKITAKAVDGRGGNISITTQGLFVSPDSTIDATSDRGINGIVEIRRPDVDPSAELVILPADVVDVSGLVAQGCSVGSVASGESSFAIAGRGGLPPTPAETTRSESILADLGIAEKSKVRSQKSKAISTPAEISNKVNPTPLVEATGWVVGSNGEVILTASVITDTLNIPWFRPNSCNGTQILQ
ncbi:filamentous hemagglutinin [Chroococcidiopsis sp. CCALA 051]|uniref:two-partner secretion domain-containing protein n=1 Tax=Chroococcidiopsis sp. CCALA 051 TaxID=869949 RepID=UPI000D0CADCA|nr:filamentous hemagglutinin N-terminal domain-containing protein [Chroococcidiopsis sp. CCALA 051]PSM46830.1 filamentous hemagglutinin [Chroococcidiopsis sp. CCALA 051]